MPNDAAEKPLAGRSLYVGIVVLLLAATALRVLAARRDIWCDEIWSLAAALQIHSMSDLFADRSDNNHLLNTLWMCFAGDAADGFVLRVPAILGGGLAVAMSGLIGARRSSAEAVFAMLLTGGAYFSVHYASEARGYGLLMGFCMLAYWALEGYFSSGRMGYAAGFVATSILGVLAHLTFLYAYMGFLAWSAYRVFAAKDATRPTSVSLVLVHAGPLFIFALLYIGWARHLEIAGGDPASAWDVVESACALAVGGPGTGALMHLAALAAAGLLIAGFAVVFPKDRGQTVFFATSIVFAPVFFYLLKPPPYLTPRYFLVSLLFALLLWAKLFAAGWEAGGMPRAAVLFLCAAFLGINGYRAEQTIAHGRGGYDSALAAIYAQSSESEIRMASDFDARNANLVAYYARNQPEAKHFTYVPQEALTPAGVDWFLLHQLDDPTAPPCEIRDLRGNAYQFFGRFGYADLSGWPWWVYKRMPAGAP